MSQQRLADGRVFRCVRGFGLGWELLLAVRRGSGSSSKLFVPGFHEPCPASKLFAPVRRDPGSSSGLFVVDRTGSSSSSGPFVVDRSGSSSSSGHFVVDRSGSGSSSQLFVSRFWSRCLALRRGTGATKAQRHQGGIGFPCFVRAVLRWWGASLRARRETCGGPTFTALSTPRRRARSDAPHPVRCSLIFASSCLGCRSSIFFGAVARGLRWLFSL